MVWNATALRFGQLGRAYIEVTIDLKRIAIDYFAVELFRNRQRQVALSRPGRTGHRNQRMPSCVCAYMLLGI